MIRKLGTLLSVAAVAYLLYIFTFYIQGEMGIVLIFFLIIAPLFSLAAALAARNRAIVTIDSYAYVKKGSELEVTVTVEKKGKFPFAVIEIQPDASEVFEPCKKRYRLSMLFADRKEFRYNVRTAVGGNGEISAGNIYSCGFLGFIRFRIKTGIPEPVSVGVIPEIPDIEASSQLFRKLADIVMTTDNDEDNDTSMMFSANSAPGYEHREYVHGDPLKRVNWKLSSKKDKLMVRLDEAVASVQPLIALDLFRPKDAVPSEAVRIEEKIICSVFGLVKALVKQGIACNFAYNGGGDGVVIESVEHPDYTDALLLKVLAVKVVPGLRLDMTKLGADVCACVVATTYPGGDFAEITSGLSRNAEFSVIAPDVTDTYKGGADLWYLDEDNNYKLV